MKGLYSIEVRNHNLRYYALGVNNNSIDFYSCYMLRKPYIPYNPYNYDLNNKHLQITYFDALDIFNRLGGMEE